MAQGISVIIIIIITIIVVIIIIKTVSNDRPEDSENELWLQRPQPHTIN